MYIVIAGGGLLGQGLAKELVEARHDVVVVETERTVSERVAARIGALAINGTATSIDILEEAGINKADVAVGALPKDADNLAFGLLARNFGVPRVIARMRNPQYESAYQLAGISRVLNVSKLLVPQLVLEIEQPSLRVVANFGSGKASIVVITVPDPSPLHGQSVQQVVSREDFPKDCVIAGILRGHTEEFVFPRGAAEICAGDQVFLAAPSDTVRKAAQTLRETK